MEEKRDRGPWIIAVAIVLAAVILVAAQLYLRQKDASCSEWQDEVRRLGDAIDSNFLAADLLEKDRPNECPVP